MQTREQRYATRTMKRLETVARRPKAFVTQYGSLCHKLPVLILSAGLAQALAFLLARASDKDASPKPGPSDDDVLTYASAHHQLLADLAWVLHADSPQEKPPESTPQLLLQRAQGATLLEYMRLTRLSLAALVWFKRFAQSLLNVEADAEERATPGGLHE